MQQLTRHCQRSKISERKMRQVIKYFAFDLTASKTAELVTLTRPNMTRIFVKIRNRIAEEFERASPFSDTVKVDEKYFGAPCARASRSSSSGQTNRLRDFQTQAVSVYTKIVPNWKEQTLQAIIRSYVAPETVIHSDGWAAMMDW